MKRITFLLSCVFGLLASVNVFSHFAGTNFLHHITKPLLMPVLIMVLWLEAKKKNVFIKLISGALIFSWAGDITLMFRDYFIYGLVFFLFAHVFYLISIIKINGPKGLLQFQPLFALPIAVYLVLLLSFFNSFLNKLKLPVFIYAIVICSVWILTMNLFWKTDRKTASLFFFGSFQFVFSDTLLAINHFVYPHYLLPGLVMATYCSAQYLLVRAAISHSKKLI